MKSRKLAFAIILIILFTPILHVRASPSYVYTDINQIDVGLPVFYLVALNQSDVIEVELERLNSGNFSIFLFDERPTQTYINDDKSLNLDIFFISSLIKYNTTINPYIEYNATETKIYYFEIMLLANGSDTFTIYSTHKLSRYYLPQIPGFPTFFLIFISCCSIIGCLIIYRRKSLAKN